MPVTPGSLDAVCLRHPRRWVNRLGFQRVRKFSETRLNRSNCMSCQLILPFTMWPQRLTLAHTEPDHLPDRTSVLVSVPDKDLYDTSFPSKAWPCHQLIPLGTTCRRSAASCTCSVRHEKKDGCALHGSTLMRPRVFCSPSQACSCS